MERFVRQRIRAAQISATSLIFTVFGDTVSQHGGSIWLSSLIDAMAEFDVNERLVRTSVYRLVKDDLLESERIGRCSYYRFSDSGKRYSTRASMRIYAASAGHTEQDWILALTRRSPESQRASELRRGLEWLGFNQLRPGLFAHPAGDMQPLQEMLSEQGVADQIVLFRAEPADLYSQEALKEVVYNKWSLDDVASHYQDFCQVYRPFLKKTEARLPSAQDCFLLRTMLVHEYRRVLLKDPQLPDKMLPGNWEGYTSHDIAAKLYKRIAIEAEAYVRSTFENALGLLPKASKSFSKRFGGLTR